MMGKKQPEKAAIGQAPRGRQKREFTVDELREKTRRLMAHVKTLHGAVEAIAADKLPSIHMDANTAFDDLSSKLVALIGKVAEAHAVSRAQNG